MMSPLLGTGCCVFWFYPCAYGMIVDMNMDHKVLQGTQTRTAFFPSSVRALFSAPVPPIVWQADPSMPCGNFGACCTVCAVSALLPFCGVFIVPCITSGNRTSIRSKLNLRVSGI